MQIPFYSRFIGGWNISMLNESIHKCHNRNWKVILDYVRESAKNEYDGIKYYQSILQTASQCQPGTFIALKMSGVFNPSQSPHFSLLLSKLVKQKHYITIDAENVATYEATSSFSNKTMEEHNTTRPAIFKTYQMYRKDALIELQRDISLAHKLRYNLGVKLVRGAYHHSDKDSGILFTNKEDTDASYNEACRILMWNLAKTYKVTPIFATHNRESTELVKRLAITHFVATNRFAFAQLLGMSDSLSSSLAQDGYTVYKYIPYGSILESIPYLIRRLHENKGMLSHISS